MEKRVKWIVSVMIVLCAGLIAGAVYLYQALFPMAEPVQMPEAETVISVTLGSNKMEGSVAVNEQAWVELYKYISEAKPTRQQAMDDTPTVRPYYCVEIQTADRQYRCFFYEDGERVYLEIPYEGIYETDAAALSLIDSCFAGS